VRYEVSIKNLLLIFIPESPFITKDKLNGINPDPGCWNDVLLIKSEGGGSVKVARDKIGDISRDTES
jgi:hypothetical protein